MIDGVGAEADRAVELEALRIRYHLIPGGAFKSVLGGAAMAISAALLIGFAVAVAWFLFHALVLLIRSWLTSRVIAAGINEADLPRLRLALFLQNAVSALVWGSTAYLFMDFTQPASVVITIGLLTGVAAHSSSNEASEPGPFILWIVLTCGIVATKFAQAPELTYASFSLAIIVYGCVMISTCLRQAHVLRETLALRFENRAMVKELRAQTAEAQHARHAAESANLAKSQFLAAASHDLRQPLYALSLFSASLGTLKLDDSRRKVVDNIQNSIAAMESLFVGLLDISRLDAGVVKPRIEPVSVDILFDRLSQYFRPIAIERGLDLRFRCNSQWVASDITLLEQVLSNLVSNALRCTTKGAVLIAARVQTANVQFEVWDTGIGIDRSDYFRVFDEFVQLNNPERDRRKGLGLGLSIAQRSAALIGTEIKLASRIGRGSRFSFSQPAVAKPVGVAANEAATADIVALERKTDLPILIVEDDADVGAALADLLTNWNIKFEIAAGATQALACIDRGTGYGLVLTDFRLPGPINGLDLITEIRRRRPQCCPAFALISGDLNPGLIAAADAAGLPLFHKPLRPDRLGLLLGR